jgi:hypothetical protein
MDAESITGENNGEKLMGILVGISSKTEGSTCKGYERVTY